MNSGKKIIIEMDAIAKLGNEIVKDDPHNMAEIGSLLQINERRN